MFVPVQIGKGHAAPIYDLVTDGKHVYTSAGDKYVVKWNLETGLQEGFTIQLDSAAYVLALADAVLFIGSTNGTLTAIDTLKKRVVWENNFFANPWMSLTYDKLNDQLWGGDSAGNLIGLNAKTGDKIVHLPFACGRIRHVVCNDTGIWLATQLEGIIQLDAITLNEITRFNPHQDSVNKLLVKKNKVLSVGKDGHLKITNWKNHEVLLAIPIHYQAIYGLEEFYDEWITCSMDKTIKIWSKEWDKALQRLDLKTSGHKKSVNGIRKISDNAFISFSDDQTWIFWRNKLTQIYWSEN